MHFVVGADGFLGHALLAEMQGAGRRSLGTTRRSLRADSVLVPFDLMADSAGWEFPSDLETAVLLAAQTSLAICRQQPETTRMLNVERTLLLAERLAQKGAFIIFPSTNHVFNGTRPDMPATAAHGPINEYGRQKAAVEAGLADRQIPHAIIRLSKIFDPAQGRFVDWVRALKSGETVEAFDDMTVAPAPLQHAVALLEGIAELRRPGIWQLSAAVDTTYADLARAICRDLGLSDTRILPRSAALAAIPVCERPAYTTLAPEGIEQFDLWRVSINEIVGMTLESAAQSQ